MTPFLVEVAHDAYIITFRNKSPNKILGVIIRLVVAAVIANYVGRGNYGIAVNFFLASMFMHGALFNVILNMVTDKEWYHLNDKFPDFILKSFGDKLWLHYLVMLTISVAMSVYNTSYYLDKYPN